MTVVRFLMATLAAASIWAPCAGAGQRLDRPFGGPPPPMIRGQVTMKAISRSCVTPYGECRLKLPRFVGTACSCRVPGEGRRAGKVR